MPGLEVHDVTKKFRQRGGLGSRIAVDRVSFTLSAGESLGIVGESGSGKTTVARMVAGLLSPDHGSITVDGTDRSARSRGRRARLARAADVQMVFQDPYLSLDPRLTAFQAVAAALRLHGFGDRSARLARTEELLDQVGLGPREAATRPAVLSGGQRQRIAIARALAVAPTFLVLDEAVSALDVSVQAQILTLVGDLRREHGIGLLFISHDLAVVRHACDRVAVMRAGEVVEEGETGPLLDHPRHPYTRLLAAAAPGPGWDPAEVTRPAGTPG